MKSLFLFSVLVAIRFVVGIGFERILWLREFISLRSFGFFYAGFALVVYIEGDKYFIVIGIYLLFYT